MGDPQPQAKTPDRPHVTSGANVPRSPFLATPDEESSSRGRLIGAVLAVAVLAILAVGIYLRAGKAAPPVRQNVVQQADPYAQNLVFSNLEMSESTSLSGGKSTFIDGRVRNTGTSTLSGVSMQVLFRNDVGLAPEVENVPLTLIRTRQPYVDIEPVSAAPLKPGQEADFRLIFETVAGNWNQQMPEMLVARVTRR